MTEKTRDAERRHQQALRRLGTEHPVCGTCGESDPHCLELHHIAGQAFGNDTAPVCRNCHRKLSDAQKDHPAPLTDNPSLVERAGHFLIGLADLFMLAAKAAKELGAKLIELAEAQMPTNKEGLV